MNKKAFTLVEMLFVVALIGIIATIVFPNILDAVRESKIEEYENVEKIIKQSMELYNTDNKEDLWQNESVSYIDLQQSDILSVNPSLNFKNCKINRMQIQKSGSNFKYLVKICCGDNVEEKCDYQTDMGSNSFK